MGTEINVTVNKLSENANILGKATIGEGNKIDVHNNILKDESTVLENAKIERSSIEKEKETMGEKITENVATEVATSAICKVGGFILKKIFKL